MCLWIQNDRQTDMRQKDGQTIRKANGKTDELKGRHTEGQTERQTREL